MSGRTTEETSGIITTADRLGKSSSHSGGMPGSGTETPYHLEARSSDRFELLRDLKYLTEAYLLESVNESRTNVLSPTMATLLSLHLDGERQGITALDAAGAQAGHPIPAAPAIDLARGFEALGREAGLEDFDPFSGEDTLLTGAMVLNSLSQAVVSAWLCEASSVGWRDILLPMLASHSRFEGLLNGAMYVLGSSTEARARELQALIYGPFVQAGSGERLWSFELLHRAVSQLACGGSLDRRGGFFPEGMSGCPAETGSPA